MSDILKDEYVINFKVIIEKTESSCLKTLHLRGFKNLFFSQFLFTNLKTSNSLSISSTGAIGVFWSLCWFLFVFETPAKHPRISDEERKEIEDAIGNSPPVASRLNRADFHFRFRFVDIEETSELRALERYFDGALRLGHNSRSRS